MHARRVVSSVVVFILIMAGGLIWWVCTVGPDTVYRIIVYNFSGIDDYRIFPQQRMSAPALSFRFRELPPGQQLSPSVSYSNSHAVLLNGLLPSTDTIAFLIVKGDALVYERYYGACNKSAPSMSFSMAKSFLSMLVGCALKDGYLRSVDQPVTDYVPELKRSGFSAVTLRHLLQMTSGIDYAENDLPWGIHPRFYYTEHLEQELLKLRLQEKPGTRFVYKSCDALLLALALKRSLGGKSITQYMQERIWHPLGMEYDGIWNIDHAPDGLEKVGSSLTATARDFAKLGRLYLHKGTWQGRQIVPEEWVNESLRSDTKDGSAWDYKYMWWLLNRNSSDFMAKGHLGQFLYVSPASDVIIVRLGSSLGGLSPNEWQQLFVSISREL